MNTSKEWTLEDQKELDTLQENLINKFEVFKDAQLIYSNAIEITGEASPRIKQETKTIIERLRKELNSDYKKFDKLTEKFNKSQANKK